MLLSAFIKLHLDYARAQFAPKTVEVYRTSFKAFQQFCGDIDLVSITPLIVERFKASRLSEVSRETVNIQLRTLKAAFSLASEEWSLLEGRNPFQKVKQLRTAVERPQYLTAEQIEYLISFMQKSLWIRNMVVFAANTGLRRGEICNLKWENVDLRNRVITVISDGGFRVKMGKFRIVPLNITAYDILKGMSRKNNETYVFTSGQKKKVNAIFLSKRFKHFVRKAGLEEGIHWHSLRHSFASLLAQVGVPIFEIKELLGHTKISVTERYSHLTSETLHRAVRRLPLTELSKYSSQSYVRELRKRFESAHRPLSRSQKLKPASHSQQQELFKA